MGKWDLTQNQARAIPMELAGLQAKQIAEALGVSKGTINNWRRDERYAGALKDAQRDATAAAVHRVQSLVDSAIGVLADKLEQGDWDAAKTVLERCGLLRSAGKDAGLCPDTEGRTGERSAPALQITLNVDQATADRIADGRVIDAETVDNVDDKPDLRLDQ